MAGIVEKLISSVEAGRARHAYLLTGNDSDRTDDIARRISAVLLFGTADVKRLEEAPDHIEMDESISIAQFRDEILPEIYRETYSNDKRAVVFRSAHLLSQMVQNAMLKVLEEPPENTHFILTGNEYGILPTIRSRCTIVRCPSPSYDELAAVLRGRGADAARAAEFARMSGGVTKRAIRLFEDESFRNMRRELFTAFFAAMRGTPDFGFCRVKRDRADWAECTELLLLLAHDLLRAGCGLGPEYCRDMESEIKKLSSVFTIGVFGCIIDKLTETAQRMATNAGGGAVFDRLFSQTALICIERGNGGRN